MASVSQKGLYALRATLELARRYGKGPTSVSEIARSQDIPPRFLELIINQLRRARIVKSRRGAQGGYTLIPDPKTLSIADILEVIEEDYRPVDCSSGGGDRECAFQGHCCFADVWQEAREAVRAVLKKATFAELCKCQHYADRLLKCSA